MRIIEITESLGSDLASACEEALRANGRLMSCVEEVMRSGSGMNERMGGQYGDRVDYRGMGMRDGGHYGNRQEYTPMGGGYGNRGWEHPMPTGYGDRRY